MKLLTRVGLTLALLLLSGCAPYKYHTQTFDRLSTCEQNVQSMGERRLARSHWLYQVIPRHRRLIRWYDIGHWATWSLFGNDDDGIFGEEKSAHFRPCMQPSLAKAFLWGCRNPLHNFCFYVIGSAHRINSAFTLLKLTPRRLECLRYRKSASTVFPSDGSVLYFALHGGKPCLALRLAWTRRHETSAYIGWRSRGNFGIKLIIWGRRKQTADSLSPIEDTGADHQGQMPKKTLNRAK